MSTIQYLRLDSDYDPIFDPAASLIDLDAVAQAIQTRLLMFQSEWWENLNLGTPMFQSILGASGSQKSQAAMAASLTNVISGSPYVSGVQNINTSFNSVTRQFSYSAIAQTSFGAVPVTVTPGSAALVET